MINGQDIFNAPIREITARVELLSGGSTYAITHNGDLVSVEIERTGANKFFGYGISQKAVVKVRDKERAYNFTAGASGKISFNDTSAFPTMYLTDIQRNENTNALTLTLNDKLTEATAHTVAELNLKSYTIKEMAQAIAAFLGLGASLEDVNEFNLYYEGGANFSGTESLREALDDIAEATQTVYYINSVNQLVFKRLEMSGAAAYTIGKAQYFTLDSKGEKTLVAIGSITELGDNVAATIVADGEAQYIRNNPFWDMREDIDDLVEKALEAVGGLTINQFNVKWRGNYLLEPTDKVALVTKDNSVIYSYVLNDAISYSGGFSQVSNWEYSAEETAHTNPSTIGEAIKQTYAKVDKVNKEIEMVVSTAGANSSAISALQLNEKSINATVESLQTQAKGVNDDIATLTNKVNAQITADDIQLEVSRALEDGVTSVKTTTGFTFNEAGLTVKKSTSEITTTISENGMTVKKGSADVLTANKDGVKAEDLHATTFLIIGKNSRLEDMGERTACFWIGG